MLTNLNIQLISLHTQFAAMMSTILCNECMEVNLGTCTIEIGVQKLQDKKHLKTCLHTQKCIHGIIVKHEHIHTTGSNLPSCSFPQQQVKCIHKQFLVFKVNRQGLFCV